MPNLKQKKIKAWACIHKPPTPKEWENDFQTHPVIELHQEIYYALSIFETKKQAELHKVPHLIIVPCEIHYKLPLTKKKK